MLSLSGGTLMKSVCAMQSDCIFDHTTLQSQDEPTIVIPVTYQGDSPSELNSHPFESLGLQNVSLVCAYTARANINIEVNITRHVISDEPCSQAAGLGCSQVVSRLLRA